MPHDQSGKRNPITLFFLNLGIGKEKDFFIENLAMLLEAGNDILSAFDTIKAEMRSSRMLRIIDEMKENAEGGYSFWRILEQSGILSQQEVSLVRLGEESGRMVENLKLIAVRQQKEKDFRSRIRSAMTYPIIIFALTATVGIGIAWFILPKLATVFTGLKLRLPLITKALIALGNFLSDYGSMAIPLFLLTVFIIFYFIFIFKKTKFIGEAILFAFPAVKQLVQQVELSRFGYVLGNLLDAGLPILEALDSLRESTGSRLYHKFYAYLRDSIDEGNSFQQSFGLYQQADKLIPVSIQQMIVAGEHSGHLAQTLIKIGEIFEDKIDVTAKNLTVILEPILLVIVWFGVLAVALAVILPIYGLIGGLNQ